MDDTEEDDKRGQSGNQPGFNRVWGLYSTIAVLADNDITKFDSITKLNVHECLTFLGYKKDLGVLEQERIARANQKTNY